MNGDQDQYETAIRALARSAEMPPHSAARIERDVQRAFAAHHAVVPSTAGPEAHGRWRPWLAAAAAVVAAAIGIEVWRDARAVTENHAMSARPAPAPAVVPAPAAPTVRTEATVQDPKTSVTPQTNTDRHRQAGALGAVRPKRPVARVVRPTGFVALPGSAGLPQFESGTIVRMELPMASLPAYGIDISPAADAKPVEADVLVGQDGQLRAMRLITNSARSVQ